MKKKTKETIKQLTLGLVLTLTYSVMFVCRNSSVLL